MNTDRKALQHAIAWAINNLYLTNQEALDIINDEKLNDADKMAHIRGHNGTDYRLANLVLLLKPFIDIAKEEYPDQEQFFLWFDEKWKLIEEHKMITKPCECKGCKVE